jgi:hypothetical protein
LVELAAHRAAEPIGCLRSNGVVFRRGFWQDIVWGSIRKMPQLGLEMILRPETEQRKITLETRPGLAALYVKVDQTQIHQRTWAQNCETNGTASFVASPTPLHLRFPLSSAL